jgi:uncharacterized protein YceH (UPF0502 family)
MSRQLTGVNGNVEAGMGMSAADRQRRYMERLRAKARAADEVEPTAAERITAQIAALQAEVSQVAALRAEVAELKACINPAKRDAIIKNPKGKGRR